MLVKHLMKELSKCNPDDEVVISEDFAGQTMLVYLRNFGDKTKVVISDTTMTSVEYDNEEDTPYPLEDK